MKGLIMVCAFVHMAGMNAWAGQWQRLGNTDENYTCVTVMRQATPVIYAGTAHGGIAISNDGGNTWDLRSAAIGGAACVRAICYDEKSRGIVIAADSGIFRSADDGKSWQRVFNGTCLAIQPTPEGIYAATQDGMVVSPDGILWKKIETGFSAKALAYASFTLVAVSEDGAYRKIIPGGSWHKVLNAGQTESTTDEETPAETDNGDSVSCVAFTSGSAGTIAVGLNSGIFRSVDCGETWERISCPGITVSRIRTLLCIPRMLLIASKTGVYVYDGSQWQAADAGIAGCRVNALAATPEDIIAATDRGLYKTSVRESMRHAGEADSSMKRFMADEPDIAALREAAVRFADAGREKINEWRSLARKKAWLPHFTVGINRETGDLWHWETGSSAKNDDDTMRRGRDSINWDVSLIWELGDLIWNTDQTSIDARSRLNAELRSEVIEQVTTLYFTRVRLKMEVAALPVEAYDKRQEKLLKQEEIAALLDGLTDGEYTELRAHMQAKKACK